MSNPASENDKAASELDWIIEHGYGDVDQTPPQGFKERTKSKFKENPVIPIGCLATAGVLGLGLASMIKGNKRHSQLLMRLRVLSQGITVMALVMGTAFTTIPKQSGPALQDGKDVKE